ncbi:E3 ubiquitin-protein ligase ATL42-like [Henckelia pumila]|uniref:E3 ubiquitin-protein ligase ATL42-like n=1 Tax=Henckelia pumila TaxID=405737 RepID=UPI003C6E005E
MIKLFLLLHFLFLIFINDVTAQVLKSSKQSGNFKPSIALVTGFLSATFLLTFLLLVYAKFCHQRANNAGSSTSLRVRVRDGMLRMGAIASGVDKAVVESLPSFPFSSIRGTREGLECAVCLSKFEDVEVLRLLPKCQHVFHIGCIDQWLERHSTCPLCRRKVSQEDVSDSRSLQQFSGEGRDHESNLDLYVEREEDGLGASRFSIGRRSFMLWSQRGGREGELPPRRSVDSDQFKKGFHRFNHRVVGYSDVLFKNRWSNVSSSDLMFLNSEFLHESSSARFMMSESSMEVEEIQKENDEITMNSDPDFASTSDSSRNLESGSNFPYPIDKRSMSEIVVHPRFTEFEDNTDSYLVENSESERIRRLWIPIARKTVQWFTDRESRASNPQGQ